MNRHEKRLIHARFVAEKSTVKFQHSATIYLGNQIIAIGVNQLKSHPLQARFGKNADSIYLHAEIDAIRNALKVVPMHELHNVTMYVARADGKLSKPCKGCQRAIVHFGITNIHWTGEYGVFHQDSIR